MVRRSSSAALGIMALVITGATVTAQRAQSTESISASDAAPVTKSSSSSAREDDTVFRDSQASGGRWRDRFAWTLNGRVRFEGVNYFAPPAAVARPEAARYAFVATQLRAAVRATFPHAQALIELQDTRLGGLPSDASLAPPFGNLGPGAIYFAHARQRAAGSTFLKQGFVTLRHSGLAATVGRFDYSDGLETVPPTPTLAWLKRSRLAERLIGPFGYTHVTRSFDGVRLAYDRRRWNLTGLAVRPTRGGYDLGAQHGLAKVLLGGGTLTLKGVSERLPSDMRLFLLEYHDDRGLLKSDSRPLAVRDRDRDPIRIRTFGSHLALAPTLGPGTGDLVVWVAAQRGKWGQLDHAAWATALEGGYQWVRAPAAPWVRAGINRTSGDRAADDTRHQTFFQIIPTTRIYAQYPFYNLMNSDDVFVQLLLRPNDRVNLRSDLHRLRLSEPADLWYSGGGATSNQVFGFSGIPSGGARSLGRLVDASVTVTVTRNVALSAYFAHVAGGRVVEATFPRRQSRFGYVEMTFRR